MLSEFSASFHAIYVSMFAVFLCWCLSYVLFYYTLSNAPRINSYFSSHSPYAATAAPHIEQTSYLCCGCLFFSFYYYWVHLLRYLFPSFFYAETKKKNENKKNDFNILRVTILNTLYSRRNIRKMLGHDGYVGYGKSP